MRTRRYAEHVRRRAGARGTNGCEVRMDAGLLLRRAASRSDEAITLVIAVTVLQATLGTAMIGFIVPG